MRRLLLAAAVLLAGCAGGGTGVPPSSSATTTPVTTSPVTTTPVTTSPATTSPATSSPVTTSPATTSPVTTSPVTTSAPDPCPAFGPPEAVGSLEPTDLDEVSGIAASRAHEGVLWVHEDSGALPQVWALDERGSQLGVVTVGGAEAVDWEDMAIGPGPDGGDWIFVADTGDNTLTRPSVVLYRFPEPDPAPADSAAAEALRVVYPDGPVDVEALLVDPQTGDAYLVAKRLLAAPEVYRIPAEAWDGEEAAAEDAGDLGFGLAALAGGPVTAADASPDGSLLAVRTYGGVWVWRRGPGVAVEEALRQTPCPAPAPPEIQGEALALDTVGYLTVSEGAGATLWRAAVSDR